MSKRIIAIVVLPSIFALVLSTGYASAQKKSAEKDGKKGPPSKFSDKNKDGKISKKEIATHGSFSRRPVGFKGPNRSSARPSFKRPNR